MYVREPLSPLSVKNKDAKGRTKTEEAEENSPPKRKNKAKTPDVALVSTGASSKGLGQHRLKYHFTTTAESLSCVPYVIFLGEQNNHHGVCGWGVFFILCVPFLPRFRRETSMPWCSRTNVKNVKKKRIKKRDKKGKVFFVPSVW